MKIPVISTAFLLLLLLLPFALRPKPTVRDAKEVLVVISVNPEEVRYEYSEGFSRWMKKNYNRSVRVEWVDLGGTSSTLRFIRSEVKSNVGRGSSGGNYDALFGGGDLSHAKLASPNCVMVGDTRYRCLQPYKPKSSVLAGLPTDLNGIRLYDPEGYWYGTALSGFGIVCNRRVLSFIKTPMPSTWEDLASPAFFSWVGSGDPRQSGSSHMVYELILQSMGWEQGWHTVMRIGANTRVFSRHGSGVSQDVALGEVACGLTIDYYAGSIIKNIGPQIAFVLPRDKTVVNPDPVSILAGAPHPELARLFVDYTLTQGQYLRYRPLGHPKGPVKKSTPVMPIKKQVYEEGGPATIALNPYDFQSSFRYNSRLGSLRWQVINDLLGAALMENHGLLIRVTRKWRRGELSREQWAKLTMPPLSEAALTSAAKAIEIHGQSKRTAFRTKWFRHFYDLYRSML
ncbi:extracellular solute-binding protein [Myxococcota bacterium]|nr:extracellular solute-binding protein [Myxococcota bacterium]MBU1536590.1 extracellular solute-binding protein [Myxococcota bacterium]